MQSRVIPLRVSPVTFHGLMDADRQLDVGREPDVILAFLPSSGLQETLSAMAEVWPGSRRLGCETVLQYANGVIGTKGVLQFLWLDEASHRIHVQSLNASPEEPLDGPSLEPFWSALMAANGGLLLMDGERFPYHQLLAEMERRRHELPPLVGALASRPQRATLQGTPGARVFLDNEILTSGCVAVGFQGVSMEIETARSFDPVGPVVRVTRATGDVLYEVDGEPATRWYRRFFTVDGELLPLPEAAHDFPLVIEGREPCRHGILRSMVSFDEVSGGVQFRGDFRVGDRVRLAVRGEGSPVPLAEAAADRRPQAIFAVSSIDRHLSFSREKAIAEVSGISKALDQAPFAGGVGFGQIGANINEPVVLQNHVTTLAFLRETTT